MAVDPTFLSSLRDGRPSAAPFEAEAEDEAADIRYSLTALGEAVVAERRGRPFRGFGPCAPAGRLAFPDVPVRMKSARR
jgi:hypothetical protein